MKHPTESPDNVSSSRQIQRYLFLDWLKVIAIGLMIYDHIFKFLYPKIELSLSLQVLAIFTPLSSFLFLAISGFLLGYTFNRRPSQKYAWHKIKRGLLLMIISYSLWLLQINPASIWSTGILQTLGVLWILSLAILWSLKNNPQLRLLVLAFSFFLILIANQFMSQNAIYIPFISSSSFPLLPHAGYFFLGLITAEAKFRSWVEQYRWVWLGWFSFLWIALNLFGTNLWQALIKLPIVDQYWQPSLTLILHSSLVWIIIQPINKATILPATTKAQTSILVWLSQNALAIYIGHLFILRLLEFVF